MPPYIGSNGTEFLVSTYKKYTRIYFVSTQTRGGDPSQEALVNHRQGICPSPHKGLYISVISHTRVSGLHTRVCQINNLRIVQQLWSL